MKWQRCQFHLAQNLLDYLPPNVPQEEASAELRGVFNAPNRAEAERMLAFFLEHRHGIKNPKFGWRKTDFCVTPTGFGDYQSEAFEQ